MLLELELIGEESGEGIYRASNGREFRYPLAKIEPGALVMHYRFPKVLWRVIGPSKRTRSPAVDVRNAEEDDMQRFVGIHTFHTDELECVSDHCPKHASYRGKTLPRSKCPGCWAIFDRSK